MSPDSADTRLEPVPATAQARALVWSLAVHFIILALLFVGMRWTQSEKPLSVAGPVVEASLVIDPNAKVPPVVKPKPKPTPPKPKPKPVPETPEPPEPEPEPDATPPRAEDTRDQEQVDELGLLEETDREREEEELRRREQIELEEIERLERERREQDRELERDEQIEDIERERREEEERRMEDLLDQERAEQDAQPRSGNEGVDESLLAQYSMALKQAIESNWTRPDTVPLGVECRINVIQVPGGDVISAEVDPNCPYDALGRRSLEAAVMKATPLPYNGFEDVFSRKLNLRFTAKDRY